MASIIKRPRAIYWYVKAFVTKKKKFFLAGFIIGLLFFVYLASDYSLSFRTIIAKENSIGLIGKYSLVNLPLEVQEKISFGLTKITEDGRATPSAAIKWHTENNDLSYIFELNPNLYWQDGTKFKSFDVNYRLKDVEIRARGDNILEFRLREQYASLPSLLSQPLFKKKLVGLGEYKVAKLTWKDGYLDTIDLVRAKDNKDKIIYKFYPSEKQALTALKLKKISKVEGITNLNEIRNENFSASDNFHNIVTIFFNIKKYPFDEKQARLGLIYGLPDSIINGFKKANGPIPLNSWYYNKNLKEYTYNQELAQRYLKDLTDTKNASDTKEIKIELLTFPLYHQIAETIAKSWTELGIKTTVKNTEVAPTDDFDVFLVGLEVPRDPDQYLLWHSTQESNISNSKNPRTDKLLEDGRKTSEEDKRLDIYQQFQKYLVEDASAAFLFYSKMYTVYRL